jgi:hypothetical protein
LGQPEAALKVDSLANVVTPERKTGYAIRRNPLISLLNFGGGL